jgi:hypothetical protein
MRTVLLEHVEVFNVIHILQNKGIVRQVGNKNNSPLSTGALHGRSQRVTIPDAVKIIF